VRVDGSRVRFLRNVSARASKSAQATVAGSACTIFEQPDRFFGSHAVAPARMFYGLALEHRRHVYSNQFTGASE
jgi:hypothetical protein